MHDIICPNCGERFIGSDVSFDISQYVIELFYKDNKIYNEGVKKAGFKFYVDEEMIVNSNLEAARSSLYCDSVNGPAGGTDQFIFKVTGGLLYKYIFNKSGFTSSTDFDNLFLDNAEYIENSDVNNIDTTLPAKLKNLYHSIFIPHDNQQSTNGGEKKYLEKDYTKDLDLYDENIMTALKMLLYIVQEKNSSAMSRDFRVAIYSYFKSQDSKYRIPDVLFINGGRVTKCCRFCGRELPAEFGYFRMKPVVLLGSHSSGKTSFLLGLLHATQNTSIFNTDGGVQKLTSDFNLTAFEKNITRYNNGDGPEKTDFENVPILNLRFKDTIYSFIDWPGEAFIVGSSDTAGSANSNYAFTSRRVIAKARHVMFFLPPEQIDGAIKSEEKNVAFPINNLSNALAWHLAFPKIERFESVTFIVNKVDVHMDKDRQDRQDGRRYTDFCDLIDGTTESHIYSGSRFNIDRYNEINTATMNFLERANPALKQALVNCSSMRGSHFQKYYIPVAPYGTDINKKDDVSNGTRTGSSEHNNNSKLCWLPFLRILKTDGLIN